jgi:hypothetical protein
MSSAVVSLTRLGPTAGTANQVSHDQNINLIYQATRDRARRPSSVGVQATAGAAQPVECRGLPSTNAEPEFTGTSSMDARTGE